MIKLILLEKLIDFAKWSFEVNGVYKWYSSITEKRTSERCNFNAKSLPALFHYLLNTYYPVTSMLQQLHIMTNKYYAHAVFFPVAVK